MKLRGELGCEIPSMVGVRIFSGTTHYTFLIKSLNFVWIACVWLNVIWNQLCKIVLFQTLSCRISFVLKIDKLQDQVQTAKEMLAKKPRGAALVEQLNVARQNRNDQQIKLEALIMARELIVDALPQVCDFVLWSPLLAWLEKKTWIPACLFDRQVDLLILLAQFYTVLLACLYS